jgi:hypothetical protein
VGIFSRWKSHSALEALTFKEVVHFQGQPIQLSISTLDSDSGEIVGKVNLDFRNLGTSEVHEIYCDFAVAEDFYLFYRGMYLGANKKHWKIDRLHYRESYIQSFDVKMKKPRKEFTATLRMSSLSSRHGNQEVEKNFTFQLHRKNS